MLAQFVRSVRWGPAAVLGLSVLLAPVAQAQDQSRLKRLTLRQETLGWESVGRLDMEAGGFCSGALIAPDLVLTAAHCLLDSRGERRPPSTILFRGALTDGVAQVERRGVQAVVHENYRTHDSDGFRQLRHDIGLLKLESPIPAASAPPFAIGRPVGQGARVSVVSYARERPDALAWQRACGVQAQGRGVLLMNCDTHFGSSGAPVFEMSSGRPRIVSVISRGSRRGGSVQVWGMEIAQPLADVKAALRAGRGVWPESQGFSARRTVVGDAAGQDGAFKRVRVGGSTLNTGATRSLGARFERVAEAASSDATTAEPPLNARIADPIVQETRPAPVVPPIVMPERRSFWQRVRDFF